MEKKFYMTPESEVVMIQTSALLAGSGATTVEEGEAPIGGENNDEDDGF